METAFEITKFVSLIAEPSITNLAVTLGDSMKKIFKWALVPLALLIGSAIYVLRPINIEREWGISSPTVPNPNGYDLILQASSQFSGTSEYKNGVSTSIDEIFGGLPPKDEAEARQKYPTARKVVWMKANDAAFTTSERALKVPFVTPPKRMWTDEYEISKARYVANCWRVKAKTFAELNQSEKAIATTLDLFELAALIKRDGEIVIMLGGSAIEAGARDIMTREVAKLNSTQAATAAKQMEKILQKRQPLSRHLSAERAAGLFQINTPIKSEMESFQEKPEPQPTGLIGNFYKRRLIREYAAAMDSVIQNADLKWSQRQSVALNATTNPKLPDLINVVERGRFFYEKTNVNADLMLTRFALHAYRKEVGSYPNTLNELTPKYLKKVPIDTFSGEILRYRREGKSYKLWSVGPDSRDDNARPALNPLSLRPASKYLVRADSQGDIVANINN